MIRIWLIRIPDVDIPLMLSFPQLRILSVSETKVTGAVRSLEAVYFGIGRDNKGGRMRGMESALRCF